MEGFQDSWYGKCVGKWFRTWHALRDAPAARRIVAFGRRARCSTPCLTGDRTADCLDLGLPSMAELQGSPTLMSLCSVSSVVQVQSSVVQVQAWFSSVGSAVLQVWFRRRLMAWSACLRAAALATGTMNLPIRLGTACLAGQRVSAAMLAHKCGAASLHLAFQLGQLSCRWGVGVT